MTFEQAWASGVWQRKGKAQALRHWGPIEREHEEEFRAATRAYALELQKQPWRIPCFGSTWFTSLWRDYVPERTEALEDDNGGHWFMGAWQSTTHKASCGHEYACTDDLCQLGAVDRRYCPACAQGIMEMSGK